MSRSQAETKNSTQQQAVPVQAATPEKQQPQTEPVWKRPHLIGLEDLSADEILHVLDLAENLKEVSGRSIKKVPALRGKVVVNFFFEDSTRTKASFTLAAQRLSADILDFSAKASSLTKGENLRDTARNIEAMGVDIFVVRHKAPGTSLYLTRCINSCIINAGDGQHEHPTQGLQDIFTMREKKGRIEGLHVAIVGDINHSRVARSNIWGLTKLGAKVTVVGPTTLVTRSFEKMGVEVSHDLDEVLPYVDVLNMLRIQNERITSQVFPSVGEYTRLFGVNAERLKRAKPDVLVMHPGPVNRGIELAADVADGPNSSILQQVTNGLAVRMAVLFLVNQAAG